MRYTESGYTQFDCFEKDERKLSGYGIKKKNPGTVMVTGILERWCEYWTSTWSMSAVPNRETHRVLPCCMIRWQRIFTVWRFTHWEIHRMRRMSSAKPSWKPIKAFGTCGTTVNSKPGSCVSFRYAANGKSPVISRQNSRSAWMISSKLRTMYRRKRQTAVTV